MSVFPSGPQAKPLFAGLRTDVPRSAIYSARAQCLGHLDADDPITDTHVEGMFLKALDAADERNPREMFELARDIGSVGYLNDYALDALAKTLVAKFDLPVSDDPLVIDARKALKVIDAAARVALLARHGSAHRSGRRTRKN